MRSSLYLLSLLLLTPVFVHAEMIPADIARKSRVARTQIEDRYGREDYSELRKSILSSAANYTLPGEFLGAIKIFASAKDSSAVMELLRQPNFSKIPYRFFFAEVERCLSQIKHPEMWIEFVLASPRTYESEICYMSDPFRDLMLSGNATPRQRHAIELYMNKNPTEFSKFCHFFKDERSAMKEINETLKRSSDPGECAAQIRKMRSLIMEKTNSNAFRLADYPEFVTFLALLKTDNLGNRYSYLEAADRLQLYDKAADLLKSTINEPLSAEEITMATAFYQKLMGDQEAKEIALTQRRTKLIQALLKAKRPKEAQQFAETFYGTSDLSKIPLFLVGEVQQASGDQRFQKRLKEEKPQKGNWLYYRSTYDDFHARKDQVNMRKIIEEAIQDGRTNNDHELTARAMTLLAEFYRETKSFPQALQAAKEASDYAMKQVTAGARIQTKEKHDVPLGFEVRRDALQCYLWLLENQKPAGWQKEWDHCMRQALLQGELFHLYHFINQHKQWDPNFSLPLNDEIFQTLCGKEFQTRNGFCQEAHHARLDAVKWEDFEPAIRLAVADAKQHSNSLSFITLFSGPDANRKTALLAKYCYDLYPNQNRGSLLIYSIPARTYEEGKTLLEKAWKERKISSQERQEILDLLWKKAPSDAERLWCTREMAKFGPNLMKD